MPSAFDPSDEALLAELLRATENPFRDPVRVFGTRIPRKLARHMERNLLRLRTAVRHHALTALPRPCAVSFGGGSLEAASPVSVVELTIPHASEIDRA